MLLVLRTAVAGGVNPIDNNVENWVFLPKMLMAIGEKRLKARALENEGI
jgi:hypothetical protein